MPPSAPRLSVVIPTRDRPTLLARALASLRPMAAVGLDVIVVDDGPTDQTWHEVRNAPFPCKRMVLGAAGVSTARNTGACEAAAPILAFLDDDDEWLGDTPSSLLSVLERCGDLGFVSADALVGGPNSPFESITAKRVGTSSLSYIEHQVLNCGASAFSRQGIYNELLRRNLFSVGAWAIRRDAFLSLGGFRPGLSAGEDWEFYLRVALHSPMAHLDEVTVAKIHVHDRNVSTNDQRMTLGFVEALDSFLSDYDMSPSDRALARAAYERRLFGVAYDAWKLGDLQKARMLFGRYLSEFGPRRSAVMHWLFCLPGQPPAMRRAIISLLRRLRPRDDRTG